MDNLVVPKKEGQEKPQEKAKEGDRMEGGKRGREWAVMIKNPGKPPVKLIFEEPAAVLELLTVLAKSREQVITEVVTGAAS